MSEGIEIALCRNIANEGRGADMTRTIHALCDYVLEVEKERDEYLGELAKRCACEIDDEGAQKAECKWHADQREALEKRMSVTLTGNALLEALYFVNPELTGDPDELESEVCLERMPERTSEGGETLEAGMYAYLAEYPEEGVYGPLEKDQKAGVLLRERWEQLKGLVTPNTNGPVDRSTLLDKLREGGTAWMVVFKRPQGLDTLIVDRREDAEAQVREDLIQAIVPITMVSEPQGWRVAFEESAKLLDGLPLSKVGCDGVLLMRVDDYNAAVSRINELNRTLAGEGPDCT